LDPANNGNLPRFVLWNPSYRRCTSYELGEAPSSAVDSPAYIPCIQIALWGGYHPTNHSNKVSTIPTLRQYPTKNPTHTTISFPTKSYKLIKMASTPDSNGMSWGFTHTPILPVASNPSKRCFAQFLPDHPNPSSVPDGNVPSLYKRIRVHIFNYVSICARFTKQNVESAFRRRQDTALFRQNEGQGTTIPITPRRSRPSSRYRIPVLAPCPLPPPSTTQGGLPSRGNTSITHQETCGICVSSTEPLVEQPGRHCTVPRALLEERYHS